MSVRIFVVIESNPDWDAKDEIIFTSLDEEEVFTFNYTLESGFTDSSDEDREFTIQLWEGGKFVQSWKGSERVIVDNYRLHGLDEIPPEPPLETTKRIETVLSSFKVDSSFFPVSTYGISKDNS